MTTVDVTVMGAGVFGLSVAYACARRGARVRVIDPHGVAAGSGGGLVGVALARGRAETAADLWQGKAVWEVVPAGDAAWMPPSPTGLVVRDTLSALIHPRRATRALADAVVALGGEVLTDGPAAGAVVWATGWAGVQEIGGTGVKGQAALLRYDAVGQPQLFADALHIIPHWDGTVAVGSTSEREFDETYSNDDQLDGILMRAYAAFPVLAGAEVLERWAGVRPRSRSRAPVLGHHPTRPGQFIANGGFKIGFGMAPKVGEVMADLVLDVHDKVPEGFAT